MIKNKNYDLWVTVQYKVSNAFNSDDLRQYGSDDEAARFLLDNESIIGIADQEEIVHYELMEHTDG